MALRALRSPLRIGTAVQPLRIVHVANFGLTPTKLYIHNVATKLSNGWVRGGHHVINFHDREAAKWSSMGIKALGRRRANKLLIELCEQTRPDLLVLGHADIVTPETIAAIRQKLPAMRVAQWSVDWVYPATHAQRNIRTLAAKAEHVDWTFLSSAGEALEQMGKLCGKVAFLPNPVDPSIETARAFEADQPTDVFVSAGRKAEVRQHLGEEVLLSDVVTGLKRRLPDVTFETHGLFGNPTIWGPAYQASISRSAMGLNMSRHSGAYLYSSDRLAHLAGNGVAVLIERVTGYGDLFGEDEMLFYSSDDELAEQIARHARDGFARKAVARKGWARYRELFDNARVAAYMLDVVFDHHDVLPRAYPAVAAGRPLPQAA
ncbi:MAG: glycosyltransferase family 1 protein [Proteobacteria bacterium]|nr:glycosyltransferase family 1 protein [Pseudomonadota bacterium]